MGSAVARHPLQMAAAAAAILLLLACFTSQHASGAVVKPVRTVADLRAAFADQSVERAELVTDILLTDAEWPATDVVHVAPGRTFVITSVSGLGNEVRKWPLLDFGFLPARVTLGLRANVTLTRIFAYKIRPHPQLVFPGELHSVVPCDVLLGGNWGQ